MKATEQFHFHYGADQLISVPQKQFRGWRRNDQRELRSSLTKDSFALEFPRARLMFRRPPKCGKSTYAAISAHWSNTTTQRRGLACELLGELKRRSRSERRGHQRRRLQHLCV